MDRTCPNCGNKLLSTDMYFCAACGFKIPKDMVLKKDAVCVSIPYKKEETVQEENEQDIDTFFDLLNAIPGLKLFIILIPACVLILVGLSLFTSLGSKDTDSVDIPPLQVAEVTEVTEKEVEYNKVVKTDSDIQLGTLNTAPLATKVPYDASIFIEGANLEDYKDELAIFDVDLDELFDVVPKSHFGFFAHKMIDDDEEEYWGWGLIFKGVSESLVESEDTLSYSDGYVLVSSDSAIISKAKNVNENLEKSLSQEANFVVSQINKPTQGKGFLHTTSSGLDYLKNIDSVEESIVSKFIDSGMESALIL